MFETKKRLETGMCQKGCPYTRENRLRQLYGGHLGGQWWTEYRINAIIVIKLCISAPTKMADVSSRKSTIPHIVKKFNQFQYGIKVCILT